MDYNFFSIVIPAHNEEKLIVNTLAYLKSLHYPNDKYEVIVVENGSNDTTYEKAKKFESVNFKIYSSKDKGVSKARNFGINKCSPVLDWCIIMDADTFLLRDFLQELNAFINKKTNVQYGTTTITPFPQTFSSRFWFWYRNWTDKFLKIVHVIHIVNKDLLQKVKYDESLTLTEDLHYGRDLSRFGKYFFMNTKNVLTSTRRFEQKGYINMFFINIYYGLLSKKTNHKNNWEVIR